MRKYLLLSLSIILFTAAMILFMVGLKRGTPEIHLLSFSLFYLGASLSVLQACAAIHSRKSFSVVLILSVGSTCLLIEPVFNSVDKHFFSMLVAIFVIEAAIFLLGLLYQTIKDGSSDIFADTSLTPINTDDCVSDSVPISTEEMNAKDNDIIYKYSDALDMDLELIPGTFGTFSLEEKAAAIALHITKHDARIEEFLFRQSLAKLGVLRNTHGMLIYVEQITDICKKIGFDDAESSLLTDVFRKGKTHKIEGMKDKFLEAGQRAGLGCNQAQSLWNTLIKDGLFCVFQERPMTLASHMTNKYQSDSGEGQGEVLRQNYPEDYVGD